MIRRHIIPSEVIFPLEPFEDKQEGKGVIASILSLCSLVVSRKYCLPDIPNCLIFSDFP